MKYTFYLTFLIFQSLISAAFIEAADAVLDLDKVLYINGPDNFQPSGLTIINDRLYTISDKHDDFIYRLNLDGDSAFALPEIGIRQTFFSLLASYDFEGITHDAEGNFFLASESHCRILKVTADGQTAFWITPDLSAHGRRAGLFQVKNAFLEGICRVSDNFFILCAERQPRGFLEVTLTSGAPNITAYPSEASMFYFPETVNKDFSGLCYYKKNVYVLERNAFTLSRLERSSKTLVEAAGWCYRHIENMPSHQYADMRYGKAEGLCIDDKFISLISLFEKHI